MHPIIAFFLSTLLLATTACSTGRHTDVASKQQASTATPEPAHAEQEAQSAIFTSGRRAATALQDTLGIAPGAYITQPVPDRENYAHFNNNPLRRAAEHPVSTFSVDVDTGAYSNVRRFLQHGQLPRRDAVRVEELINYFDYDYQLAPTKAQPFGVTTELARTPWNDRTRLLQIGIQGWKPQAPMPPANLVFLIDVSGSMNSPDKLPLLQTAMKLLVKQLDREDRVSIVVYAGAAGTVLEPTPGNQHARITRAIDELRAGGSTNGGAGITLAYSLAEQAYIQAGVNRIILASDGDFNVGTTNFQALLELVAQKRKSSIALTTLGFGTGNYNDHLVEQLANKGNGNYAYIDNLAEAQRVLVNNRAATLQTIAKDVKIQIEFNPEQVAEYRLIGYENRALAREDFNNDQVDAGEIGAGHSVTALYEVALVGTGGERIEPLRYKSAPRPAAGNSKEMAFVRLRYKLPDTTRSRLIEIPVLASDEKPLANASDNLRFAAAVAAFGQLLRGAEAITSYNYDQILELARQARGQDADGRRGEFLQLVQLAMSLATQTQQAKNEATPGNTTAH